MLVVRSTSSGSITTIPALAGGSAGCSTMAHIAASNGWKTTFVLVNTGTSAAPTPLQFFDDYGNPLVGSLSFPQSGNSAAVYDSKIDSTLNAGATLLIESD